MSDYYKITTDSGCDLLLSVCVERDIMPYFMPCSIDGETYIDAMTDESFHKFYDQLRAGKSATTSQINPSSFVEFWEPLAREGTPVMHISLGSAISGTCANAVIAAGMLKEQYPGWTCRVVDSTSASAGVGLLVLRAADNRDKGMALEDNARDLESIAHNNQAIFTTDDLTALYRGGRVSKVAAVFGTALNIIPIMHLGYDGHLEVWQKVRGEKQCRAKILADVQELVENPGEQTLIISEADALDKAHAYGEMLKDGVGFKDVFYTHIGPTIGAHTGPGLISIFFVGKVREDVKK